MHTRVLEPRQITILTTSKCTAACRHCCMNSSPERSDTLTWEQLEKILSQAFTDLRLKLVIFAGGEPMLLGNTLYKALRMVKSHGLATRMVTNAYWASSREHAQLKLRELEQAGLDELNISSDDYHLDFIKLDAVRNAYELALTMNFSAVVLANCFGPESHLTPERIRREFGTADMKLRFDDDGATIENHKQKGKTLVVLSNSPVQSLARGCTEMKPSELPAALTDSELDRIGDLVGGCPWAIRSAAISAKGHFVACCGFEVEDNPILDYGSLDTHPLAELVDKADNDLVTNMIAILGPIKVMRLLQRICPDEISFPRGYRSYCEVCFDLVSLKQNRDALYRHMDEFVEVILAARNLVKQTYLDKGVREYPPLRITADLSASPGPSKTTPIADWRG
ncbi:MAG: radical SAM protein [Deltaproteobacteria bacterium]|nr:radical SAM protein [Deltaproteobacteria bacterium]